MKESMEDNIKRIHSNSVIVDAHFDLLMDVTTQREYGRRKVIETDHLPGFVEGGVNIIVSSIFIDSAFLPEMALRKAMNQISSLYAEIDESPDKIMICRNYDDISKAQEEKKIGLILSFEGVEPLYNDLNLLRVFYELGVRIVGLVWSRRNFAGDGSHFSNVREGKKGGITSFGVQLIEEAERLGMFIDISHLNDEGFWDVMEVAKKPVIASHSNCRSIVNSMRNLTDDQIKAMAQKGGVIGMNASSMFTAYRDEDGDIEHLIDHVDHIVKLVGPMHVGLGFDFCDGFMKYLSEENLAVMPCKPFDVLKGHKSIEQFTKGLIERGYKDDEIEMILGKNFLRIYKEVLK
jgi:membrane dipeptidase